MLIKKVEKMSLLTKIVEILINNEFLKIILVDNDKSKKTHFILLTPLVVDW